MTGKLNGKLAIVTGSDSGIGQAIAIEFAREGASVAISYFKDRAGAEATQRDVEATGQRAFVLQLDQRDPAAVDRAFGDIQKQLGTPFILVNDAGVDTAGKPVAEMSLDEWDDRIRTNLYGPFYCCQHFIRARKHAGGRGKIINITSVHEDIPRIGSAGYDASKGGECSTRSGVRPLLIRRGTADTNSGKQSPVRYSAPWFAFAEASVRRVASRRRGRDISCPIPPAQIRTSTSMHTALILDAWRQSARWGKDGERTVRGANVWPVAACAPSSRNVSDCDELKFSATSESPETGYR